MHLRTPVLKQLALKGRMSIQELAQATGLTLNEVRSACRTMVPKKLIIREAPGVYRIGYHGQRVLKDNAPVRRSTLEPKAWRSMRNLRVFSVEDIQSRIDTGENQRVQSTIRGYVNALERAGYVVRMPRRAGPDGVLQDRWMLVNNTGFEAPVWRRSRYEMYDPNTRKTVSIAHQKEAA